MSLSYWSILKIAPFTSSYIKAYLERGNEGINIHQIICIEFQENDHIVQIDDEYNDTFSYMSLSVIIGKNCKILQ